MDRLFAQFALTEQHTLVALAQIEERLQRAQRLRRQLVAATALASVLCWALPRLAPTWSRWAPLLYGVLAVAALAAWAGEQRIARLRDPLFQRLPPEYHSPLGTLQ